MADLANKTEKSIEEVNEMSSNIAADWHFILQMQKCVNEPCKFTAIFKFFFWLIFAVM